MVGGVERKGTTVDVEKQDFMALQRRTSRHAGRHRM